MNLFVPRMKKVLLASLLLITNTLAQLPQNWSQNFADAVVNGALLATAESADAYYIGGVVQVVGVWAGKADCPPVKGTARTRGAGRGMVSKRRRPGRQPTVWQSVCGMWARHGGPSPVAGCEGRGGLGTGFPARYVVGLNLDAARLPGSHPVWMQVKAVLHTLRLPGPAIVMGPAGTRAVGLYW